MQDQTVPQEANSQVDNKTTNDANSIATNSELKNPQTLIYHNSHHKQL